MVKIMYQEVAVFVMQAGTGATETRVGEKGWEVTMLSQSHYHGEKGRERM